MKLTELLVVIVVLGIVFTILVSVFSSFRSVGYLIEAETQIIGLLRNARSRTLASQGNTQYGVHFEETMVVLFAGATYPSVTLNETYTLPASVRLSNIALSGGGNNIVYTRLTGIPVPLGGTITIQLRSNTAQTKTINISATGVIN